MGPSLVVSIVGWAVGIQKHPDSPILLIHCAFMDYDPSACECSSSSCARRWYRSPHFPGFSLNKCLASRRRGGLGGCGFRRCAICIGISSSLAGLRWTIVVRGWVFRRALSPRRASFSRPLYFGLMDRVSYTHLRYTSWLRPYSADDNCPCIQLPDGCFARWC